MRIVDVRGCTVPISRYRDAALPSGGLTTSVVMLVTDLQQDGAPVIGYGFSSFGRFGQGGLIRERFAPRLSEAPADELLTTDGSNFDPVRAWTAMMAGEKPGGHGERCVAVGTLDMAIWDAAAKIAGLPLHRHVAESCGRSVPEPPEVTVYASGGYPYPDDDLLRLREEIGQRLDEGYRKVKIKIGAGPLAEDLKRIEAALELLPGPDHLAVDAMNRYGPAQSQETASALERYGLWWFEDICDPLDFETQSAVAQRYAPPIAAGEALFSSAEAKLLLHHGGLRPERDILLFDPVHCYGLTHYLEIVETLKAAGWPRRAFWPHGGHLFALQLTAALGLGGCEVNPASFQPFGGAMDGAVIRDSRLALPDAPGIGFETRGALMDLFKRTLE